MLVPNLLLIATSGPRPRAISADARHVVPGIEGVPMTSQIGLEPGDERLAEHNLDAVLQTVVGQGYGRFSREQGSIELTRETPRQPLGTRSQGLARSAPRSTRHIANLTPPPEPSRRRKPVRRTSEQMAISSRRAAGDTRRLRRRGAPPAAGTRSPDRHRRGG